MHLMTRACQGRVAPRLPLAQFPRGGDSPVAVGADRSAATRVFGATARPRRRVQAGQRPRMAHGCETATPATLSVVIGRVRRPHGWDRAVQIMQIPRGDSAPCGRMTVPDGATGDGSAGVTASADAATGPGLDRAAGLAEARLVLATDCHASLTGVPRLPQRGDSPRRYAPRRAGTGPPRPAVAGCEV
jgi:hypothetical protein